MDEKKSDKAIDFFETALISFLEISGRSKHVNMNKPDGQKGGGRGLNSCENHSLESFMNHRQISSKSAWIAGWSGSNDRLYTTDKELLMNPIKDIFGNRSEIALPTDEGKIKWIAYKKTRLRRPFWTVGNATVYLANYALIGPNGVEDTSSNYIAISKSGDFSKIRYENQIVKENIEYNEMQAVLAASLIEDCSRKGQWHVEIFAGKSIKISTNGAEILDLFSSRKGPHAISKKRPLLHWVASHSRRKKNNAKVTIPKHLRGITEFEIDGLGVRITEPIK